MPEGLPGPVPRRDDAVRGILLIAAGYAVVSCSDAAIKYAVPQVGPAGAMVWRGIFGALLVALLARGLSGSRQGFATLIPRRPWLMARRALLHCLVSLTFYGVWARGLELADSYAISAAAPLLMTLLAIPMLGEQVGWRRWTSTLLGFAGVLFMLQPGGSLWRVETPLLLVAVGLLAVTRIWTRVLARHDLPATIAFWVLLVQVPFGLVLLPFLPPPVAFFPDPWTMLILMVFGGCNGLAHFLFARAFALAPVSVLAPFEYSTLIWGALLGLLIWGEFPAGTTLIGAGVVILAGLYNLHRERLRAADARRAAAEAPG